LHRTGVGGGGAPHRSKLALARYARKWKQLNTIQRKRIKKEEITRYTWINHHDVLAVYSADCAKRVLVYDGPSSNGIVQPCDPCAEVLNDKRFQNALRRKMPSEAHMRFSPSQYRPELLGAVWSMQTGVRQLVEMVRSHILYHKNNDIYLEFSRMAISGNLKGHEALLGLIEYEVRRFQRLSAGKSLCNMEYPHPINEVMNI
ncbi:hypothetical protein BOTBODRAFT_71936, partial [Botryobasidium botryosum FD-172 SS1]